MIKLSFNIVKAIAKFCGPKFIKYSHINIVNKSDSLKTQSLCLHSAIPIDKLERDVDQTMKNHGYSGSITENSNLSRRGQAKFLTC